MLDPSGAAVPGLAVTLVGPAGAKLVVQTDDQGRYAFHNLAPGSYTVTITLKGFNDFIKSGIVIARGQAPVVNAQLSVAVEKEQVTVTDTTTKVNVNPSENTSAVVIKGKDLESLSDDPDELQSELEALAGPSAGPNGGQIYIDGFTGGQLPAKSSIREIRVNQNPFSAQYDTLGYGRIEILTKPGTDKLHGQVFVSGNDSAFNTRNPFAGEIPGYHSEMYDGNIGGPLGKKTSFFFDGSRRNIEDVGIVNAYVLDSDYNQVPFNASVPTPQTRTELSPRIDRQLSNNNTLTVRYQLWENNAESQGVGQFSLPSQAYNSSDTENAIQISDAQVLNEKAVTEVRFRYTHETSSATPMNSDPTVSVPGAFTGGGSSAGTSSTTYHSYEIQDYTSVAMSKNFLKFGARLRSSFEAANSTSKFNGVFTFPSLDAYQITEQGMANDLTPEEIRAAGGGASQFVIIDGNPLATVQYLDFEPYVEDDWKARPNLTVSAGLRFETQNHISDKADFAPRLGIAWGLGKGKSTKTVLRTGSGVFYDRFGQGLILNTNRLNGINQQQYIIANPDFYPAIPPINTIVENEITPTVTSMDPNLRTAYTVQSGIGLERQVTKFITVSATYLNTHGVHQFLSRNINAPYPGTSPSDPRPDPSIGDLYQYESIGLYNQNQLIANFNIRGSKVSLFGFYTLSSVKSNTSGAGSFPTDQYDVYENYGRAAYDVRNRFFLGGNWNLPRGFQISPFMVANSAPPFNISVGEDLNGDSIFNDRPSFASNLSNPANVVKTEWGSFNTVPVAGETIIPINYGTGFGQFAVNLRLSKTFGFGKEVQGGGFGGPGGGGGPRGRGLGPGGLSSMGSAGMFGRPTGGPNRRYNLTFSVSARNLFNNVNYAQPVGTLGSPSFGQPIALVGGFFSSSAANRRIDLQARFTF